MALHENTESIIELMDDIQELLNERFLNPLDNETKRITNDQVSDDTVTVWEGIKEDIEKAADELEVEWVLTDIENNPDDDE